MNAQVYTEIAGWETQIPRKKSSEYSRKPVVRVVKSTIVRGMDEATVNTVLEQLRPKLNEAFKFNPKCLADDLMLSEHFLDKENHETVTDVRSTLNKSNRARIMVDSLISKVCTKPENHQRFLLQGHKEEFGDVVDRLESESNLICRSVVSLGLGGLVFRKSSSCSVFTKF